MIRDFGRAFVIVLVLLIVMAEVQRRDEQQNYGLEQ
jgi:hypothetical protein